MDVFRSRLRELAKPSKVLSPAEMDEVQRLSQSLTLLQNQSVQELLRVGCQEPILLQYQGDSTPVRHAVHVTTSSSQLPSRQLKRVGQTTSEAYIQRVVFLCGNKHSGFRWAHRVYPPWVLAGKSSWHQWACVQEAQQPLLSLGHQGIAITVYVFDRAVLDSLAKKLHQAHEHRRVSLSFPPSPVAPADRDWVMSLGCSVHDAHNCLKWAMAMTCDVTTCCRALHNLLEGLRRCLPLIHQHLGQFLAATVVFRKEPRDAECTKVFWSGLGVAVDWLDLAVELDPEWFEGHVIINGCDKDKGDTMDKLIGFYLFAFRFRASY